MSTEVAHDPNWKAYDVGASFNFFIIDTYGEDRLQELFRHLGTTRDLERSVSSLFNVSVEDLEQAWLAYLPALLDRTKASAKTDPTPPQIIEMFPPHNATDVSVNITEIVVMFNTAMSPDICIGTPGQDTGISYKNAFWETETRLVISVKPALLPDFSYRLSLGYPGQCGLKSAQDMPLPVTEWHFTTGQTVSNTQ